MEENHENSTLGASTSLLNVTMATNIKNNLLYTDLFGDKNNNILKSLPRISGHLSMILETKSELLMSMYSPLTK